MDRVAPAAPGAEGNFPDVDSGVVRQTVLERIRNFDAPSRSPGAGGKAGERYLSPAGNLERQA